MGLAAHARARGARLLRLPLGPHDLAVVLERAPVSWLTQQDVEGGRAALNFSEWNKPQDGAGDLAEAISGGSMPPWFYRLMHPEAKLSHADEQRLIAGLAATLKKSPPVGGGG